MRCHHRIAWVIFASLIGQHAGALDDQRNRTEHVIVSAIRGDRPRIDIPASIEVIDQSQISASGAKHIADVLRNRGGVQLADLYGDGSRTQISMRGFGANAAANTLVLVDGRRLNNTDLAAADLNSVALATVERIEIIQGSAGVLFGDQAVGGVINIVTRVPEKLAGSIEIDAGSFNRYGISARASQRVNSGLFYEASATFRQSANYRENNGIRYGNGLGRVGYDYGLGSLFVEYQHVEEDLELPGGIFMEQLHNDRTQSRFSNDLSDTQTDIARLGMRHTLHEQWQLLCEYTSRRSNGEGILTNVEFQQERHHRSVNPRLIGTLAGVSGDMIVTLGADLEETDYGLRSVFGLTNNNQQTYSVYAQLVLPVTEYFSLSGGVRRASMDNRLFDRGPFGVFPDGIEQDDAQTASTLGVNFFPAESWRVFLRRDESYRFPLADERNLIAIGTSGLDTQTGESIEAGIEWDGERHSVTLLGYRLDLENEIDFDPGAGFFGANTNLDPTSRSGVIVQGFFEINTLISLGGSYTYTDAEFSSGPLSGNTIPFVARHQGALRLSIRPAADLEFYVEVLGISERVASGDFSDSFQHLPGHGVLNVNVNYNHGGFFLSARINNMFANDYSDFAATAFNPATFATETGFFPAPEINFLVTAGYRIP
jgi:iron complex outermembrane receptor protein